MKSKKERKKERKDKRKKVSVENASDMFLYRDSLFRMNLLYIKIKP